MTALSQITTAIESLPAEDRLRVAAIEGKIRYLLEKHGPHGRLALAKVGAEMSGGPEGENPGRKVGES